MKPRYLLLLLIAIGYIGGNFVVDRWGKTLYYGDSNGYYLHVVSFFVNQDVGDYDKTITTLRQVNPDSSDPREDVYGIRLTDKGRRYIKYTVGVPLMEAPFFLLAHAYTKLTSQYPADGWSKPYLLAVGFAIIFYVLLGFYLLIGILQRYFSSQITTLVVLSLAFATNLFFHATYVTMAHGFLFFDYCLLLYLTIRFYETPSTLRALGLGAMVGLITLTRVPEIVSALIPLLWGVTSMETLRERLRFIGANLKYVVAAPVGFLLGFSLQFAYWYYVSGHLIFNPYEGEGFNFLKPNILRGWFDFANGWLIYTPIMAFSLLGWPLLRRYCRAPQLAILAFVGLHAYIHYSYYAWTYFPGLGSRPMVETYPLLAFGLAASYQYCSERKWLRWLPVTALVLFTALNLFQTWQMRQGIIWSERGNRAFYLETFATLTPTLNSHRAYESNELQPDEADITLVKPLVQQGFEDTTLFATVTDVTHSGNYALYDTREFLPWKAELNLSDMQPRDWLKVGVSAYIREADRLHERDKAAVLVVEIVDENGKKKKWKCILIAPFIGNKEHHIWPTGEVNMWDEASFYVRLPRGLQPNWRANVFVWNAPGQKMILDDLYVELYWDR